jgi:hypothetical protein
MIPLSVWIVDNNIILTPIGRHIEFSSKEVVTKNLAVRILFL